MQSNKFLDVKGLACPMPIVYTKKAMDKLELGQILEVHTTDRGALADMSAWAKAAGHIILNQTEAADVLTFFIRKV